MNPCELHCRPEHEYFAEKLRDAVVDGTPCYDSDASRDVCINGICKVGTWGHPGSTLGWSASLPFMLSSLLSPVPTWSTFLVPVG